MGRTGYTAAAMFAVLLLGAVSYSDPKVIRTGILDSLFQDIPRQTIRSTTEGFKTLMQEETGDQCVSLTFDDLWALGDQLTKDELQFGVCNGFEFAWLHQKYPSLQPLVIAVNQILDVRAHLLGAAPTDFAALRGKSLAIPERTKAYCRLFLERDCQKAGMDPDHYFGSIAHPSNLEDALDDAVDKKVQAVLVDSVGLLRYQARKPARARQLKEIAISPVFPPSVVIYQPGSLDSATLRRFRQALLRLDRTTRGQVILREWKLTQLQPVPDSYTKRLEEIAKIYPPLAVK
jgi:ABC-type phosphate/phosphonate transport system substrate-binding protein